MNEVQIVALSVGVSLAATAAFVGLLALLRQAKNARRPAADSFDPSSLSRDVAELIAQLDGAVRDADSRIEKRFSELQSQLEQAKQISAELRSLGTELSSSLPADGPHAEILRLRRQGMSAEDIARLLNMHVGKVELVLNLFRARQQAGGKGVQEVST
jgi:TolA-binding protein